MIKRWCSRIIFYFLNVHRYRIQQRQEKTEHSGRSFPIT